MNGLVLPLVNTLVYPLLGYGIEKYGHQMNKIYYSLCVWGGALLSVLGAVIYGTLYPDQLSGIDNVLQQFTPIIACGLFGFVMCHSKNNLSLRKNNILNSISSTVFGIFLIEDIVRNQIEKLFIYFHLDSIPNDFAVGVLFTLSSFVVSMGIIYIFKKITYINKLI